MASGMQSKQFESIVNKIRDEVLSLKKDVKRLQEKKEQQDNIIHDLQRQLKVLDTNSETIPNASTDDTSKITTTHNTTLHKGSPFPLHSLLSRKRRAVNNIAFSTYLSQSNQHMTNEAIKFDRILLNEGNGYNAYTGAFTAPVTGIYLFSYHFDSTKTTFVRLVVNGVNEVDGVANAHVVSGARQAQSMGGNTCIIQVVRGQAVLVEVFEVPDATINSSDNFHFSTFSGVLLYE
ncbi:complement C1q-like protein 4 [Mya arenaria]|uniref:complement C1q-like protein 4 n=1 Tax=Mya arenaria TaxID=6604 RepID=UPI0022E2D562|nr:complement C1q-like protein 4 [Mya arenaria]